MPDDVRAIAPRRPLNLALGPEPSLSFIDLRCSRVELANESGQASIVFDWEDGNRAIEFEIPLDEALEFRIGELYRFDIGPRPCPPAPPS